MEEKISVIVPVYNVEKYLPKCIDSILSQTYSNLELILVDDGSPDNCPKICDEYAEKDDRIVVIHKVNGGVSSARNEALKVMTGSYVTFVDSDDYVNKNYLYNLISEVEVNNCNLVMSGMQIVDEKYSTIEKHFNNVGIYNLLSENDRVDYIINNILYNNKYYNRWSICSSLFEIGIIKENNIIFNLKCDNYAEDLCFVLEYILYINKIIVTNFCDYCYVQHESSKMHTTLPIDKLNEKVEVAYQFNKRFVKEIKSKKVINLFPVIFWGIVSPQYSFSLFYSGQYDKILNIKIEKIEFHNKNLRKLLFYSKELEKAYCFYASKNNSKQLARIALLNSRFAYHRNVKLYKLESYIMYKFFIK